MIMMTMATNRSLPTRLPRMWPHAVLIGASALILGCSSGPLPPDERPYEKQILDVRVAKDAMFRSNADESPIPAAERAGFPGLAYYPVDPAYRLPAFLKEDRSGPPLIIELRTSTNEPQPMRRVGTLGFTVNGASCTLLAFADVDASDMSRLFVPFADLTSGRETYGGGRYIDLDRTPTGLYDLDFNRAYHPSCVYNHNFVCPVPPRENRLPVAIHAGERLAAQK
jgi:uncharacterized protein (DUF1684 family)